ncbi:hypothetical protein OG21DRAFT_934128 [Imleria badia]|nr:hypothetical protein OG21DRAFT_934128 [Imleria badia]
MPPCLPRSSMLKLNLNLCPRISCHPKGAGTKTAYQGHLSSNDALGRLLSRTDLAWHYVTYVV